MVYVLNERSLWRITKLLGLPKTLYTLLPRRHVRPNTTPTSLEESGHTVLNTQILFLHICPPPHIARYSFTQLIELDPTVRHGSSWFEHVLETTSAVGKRSDEHEYETNGSHCTCSRRDTVRKAARFAVYVAIMMNPNTHQVAAMSLPDSARGASPPPGARGVIRSSLKYNS